MRLVFTRLPQSVMDTDSKSDRERVKGLVSMTLSSLTCKMGLVPYSPTMYYYRGMILDLHSTLSVLGRLARFTLWALLSLSFGC